jgi:hypothetical protein
MCLINSALVGERILTLPKNARYNNLKNPFKYYSPTYA